MGNTEIRLPVGIVEQQLSDLKNEMNAMSMKSVSFDTQGESKTLVAFIKMYTDYVSCLEEYLVKVNNDISHAELDLAEMKKADQQASTIY